MFVYNGKSNKFFKRPPVPKKGQPKGLRIIIVGCGKVGATLVEQLSREGHDLTIIDKSPQRIQSITGLFDVMGIVGNGASYSVQMEAGIEDADLIIAVTNSDELNLLCCTVAKRVGGCAAIARVRTPDYSTEVGYLREKLGLAMIINPELEAAKEAARILYLPTALEVNSFAHGQAELIKFKVPEGNMLDGMTIAFLGKTIAHNILICAVERGKEIFIPSGDFQMKKGDIISFVSSRRSAKDFLETIGFKTNRVKSTMIIGGGKAAYYLAKQLLHMGISVKIIEIDKARCEELSILLPKAVIINGDGTNEDLLKEEGIEYTESFVALTGIDEENILLTLYDRSPTRRSSPRLTASPSRTSSAIWIWAASFILATSPPKPSSPMSAPKRTRWAATSKRCTTCSTTAPKQLNSACGKNPPLPTSRWRSCRSRKICCFPASTEMARSSSPAVRTASAWATRS